MNALTLVFATLCIFALAYRYYGIFLATKVLNLDPGRTPPAIVFVEAFIKWFHLLKLKELIPDRHGVLVLVNRGSRLSSRCGPGAR